MKTAEKEINLSFTNPLERRFDYKKKRISADIKW